MTCLPTESIATLLVVDDDALVLRLLIAILSHANFRVLSASNGVAALEIAREHKGKIHLLLSDIDMPLMDGPSLVTALRALRPEIPAMMMSGGNYRGLKLPILLRPVIDKPFNRAALVGEITSFLFPAAPPDKSTIAAA